MPKQVFFFNHEGRILCSNGEFVAADTVIGRNIKSLFPVLEHLDIEQAVGNSPSFIIPGVVGDDPFPKGQFFDYEITRSEQAGGWRLLITERTAHYKRLQQQQQLRNEQWLNDKVEY